LSASGSLAGGQETSGVSVHELYDDSRRAAIWGMAVNLGLGLVKLVGGLYGNSVGLVSDAAHSLGDAVVSGIVVVALLYSERPPDREHPYGHTRMESVAGSAVALLLIITALVITWQAIATLGSSTDEPELYTIGIAAGSVLLKEGLYRYNRRVAQRTGSSAVLATAWDHRLDAFGSLAVLVGLILAKWPNLSWHAADHVAAVIVALMILLMGGRLFWNSLQELLDRQASPEMLATVRREASAVPGVLGVEKLLVRKAGIEYLVDIHIEVDPEITVREGHAIAHAVKDRLIQRIVPVKDVLVHIEPAPVTAVQPHV
jgi:cation diffusion facilitator family transporter